MGKKKSKTQKNKINARKKAKKQTNINLKPENIQKSAKSKNKIEGINLREKNINLNSINPNIKNDIKEEVKEEIKEEIKYITQEELEAMISFQASFDNLDKDVQDKKTIKYLNEKKNKLATSTGNQAKKTLSKSTKKIKRFIYDIILAINGRIRAQKRSKKITKRPSYDIELPKLKNEQKKKYTFLDFVKGNIHILFNAILIITFIIMLLGLIRINAFKKGTIIYISCIIGFLMLVAMSYNKYISGKVFTLILCAGMSFAIYQMQYTYDFIRNLNFNSYEYKTYYVVTFDNGVNKSIYNLNNKKIGLLKDNCTNIERILNTKLDKVNYLEYENINSLFNDFYDQEFRAILVNENQYKYLLNNFESSRSVKILYEFQANARK